MSKDQIFGFAVIFGAFLYFPITIGNHLIKVFWISEVHVRRLRIRVVSQCVVCDHSEVRGICLFVRVFFFTDSHGSTSYIFLYVSFD